VTEPRWLDTHAAAAYLSLREDAFTRKVRAGIVPAPSYSLGERTPRWWSPDLDSLMRAETASTDTQTAVEALAEEIRAKAQSRPRRQAYAR
jgi:hypothetical protein